MLPIVASIYDDLVMKIVQIINNVSKNFKEINNESLQSINTSSLLKQNYKGLTEYTTLLLTIIKSRIPDIIRQIVDTNIIPLLDLSYDGPPINITGPVPFLPSLPHIFKFKYEKDGNRSIIISKVKCHPNLWFPTLTNPANCKQPDITSSSVGSSNISSSNSANSANSSNSFEKSQQGKKGFTIYDVTTIKGPSPNLVNSERLVAPFTKEIQKINIIGDDLLEDERVQVNNINNNRNNNSRKNMLKDAKRRSKNIDNSETEFREKELSFSRSRKTSEDNSKVTKTTVSSENTITNKITSVKSTPIKNKPEDQSEIIIKREKIQQKIKSLKNKMKKMKKTPALKIQKLMMKKLKKLLI